MATNVSSYRVAITGDAAGLNAELTKASASVATFSRTVTTSQQRMTSAGGFFGGSRTTQIIQNLGYAAEDASVSFGTNGLAGALRGSANNLAMVAGAINPLAGALTGIGLAIASAVIPALSRMGKESEEATDRLQGLIDAAGELMDIRRRRAPDETTFTQVDRPAFQRDAQSRVTADAAADNAERLQAARDELARIAIQQEDLLKRSRGILSVAGLGDLFAEILGNGAGFDRAISHFQKTNPDFEISPEVRAQLARLETERLKLVEQARQEQKRVAILEQVAQDSAKLATEANAERVAGWFQNARDAIVGGIMSATVPGEVARPELRSSASQGLAGGFEFGSREAVSALNRAAFATSKTEEKIERNTSKTEVAVRDVVKAVRDLGQSLVPTIAGDAL